MVLRLTAILLCAMHLTGQSPGPAAGVLVAVGDGSVSVTNDGRIRRFVINQRTEVWRGQRVAVAQLRAGDQLDIRYRILGSGQSVATQIWANIERWDGKVIRVTGNSVEVARMGEHGEPLGMATVAFDSQTVFSNGSLKGLRVGREIEVVGLVLNKHRLQATRVLHILE